MGTWFICLTTRFLTRRLNYISCSIFRIFQSWVPYLNFLNCHLFLSSFNFLYSSESHFLQSIPFPFFPALLSFLSTSFSLFFPYSFIFLPFLLLLSFCSFLPPSSPFFLSFFSSSYSSFLSSFLFLPLYFNFLSFLFRVPLSFRLPFLSQNRPDLWLKNGLVYFKSCRGTSLIFHLS